MTILGCDHLIHVVSDLEAASAAYGDAGFTVSDRPDMPNGRNRTRFVAFADGCYIMLMQYLTVEAARAHRLGPAAALGDGWADYSLRTDDIDDATARLTAAGVAISGPVEHRGSLTTGEAWALRLVYAGHGAAGDGALPYFVEDIAPRSLRLPPSPSATHHPNGAMGVSNIAVMAAPSSLATAAIQALLSRGEGTTSDSTQYMAADATLTLIEFGRLSDDDPRRANYARRGSGVLAIGLKGPRQRNVARIVAGAVIAI